MKRQNNFVFRDSQLNQIIGNAVFRAVVLNPDFIVFDVEMQHLAVNPFVAVPTQNVYLVMIIRVIKNRLHFKLVITRFYLAVFAQNFFDSRSEFFYVCHFTISSLISL